MAGVLLLPRIVRDDVARDLTYSGRIFSGEEALAQGLATRVCADPRTEGLAYGREVASKNPAAIRAAKRLLNLSAQGDQRTVLISESEEQVALIGSRNQIEAVRAKFENRTPSFSD
jgi:enoyl-CoA hydratase/carnithine racemase